MPSAGRDPVISNPDAPALPEPRRTTPRLRWAALALGLALTAAAVAVAPSRAAGWAAGEFSAASELELANLTNASRTERGLAPLELDEGLRALARWRSRDMTARDYFSHAIPPDGSSVFDAMQRRGYCFDLAGENIGWNTYPDGVATRTIHEMFLESPGHRRNVVGARWEAIGVGAFKTTDGKKMWTVLFADRCEPDGDGSTGGPLSHVVESPARSPAAAVGAVADALVRVLAALLRPS